MKRLLILFLSFALLTVAQGQDIGPKKCKTCGKPLKECQYKGRHPQPDDKPDNKPAIKPTKPNKTPVNPTPAAKDGSVYITSTPSGAVVKLDGTYIGETPTTVGKLTPGSHTVTFSKEGYESISKTITIKAGKETTCTATLKDELAELNRKGNEYYDAKQYEKAVEMYRKAAEQGYAIAQCNLGWMYDKGRGVPQDCAEAVRWYRKAAEQGNAHAQCNLGYMYYQGQGVPQDYAEAVRWYRKAAEQGNATAQFNLGWCYKNGLGVSKDLNEARRWFQKAADQGHESAKEQLQKL